MVFGGLGSKCTNGICRLKLKRPQAAKKFRAELDRMYEEALAEESLKAKL